MNANYKMPAISFLSMMLLILSGCATYQHSTQPNPQHQYAGIAATEQQSESLFDTEDGEINDEMIKKVFAYHYRPQSISRIAIFPLGRQFWFGWNTGDREHQAQLQQHLVETLNASKRIYDATYLPSILIPVKIKASSLRMAAARYQADLMLLYQTQCSQYKEIHIHKSNEYKFKCNIEAILLDTRTGLVPFAGSASEDFKTTRQDDDMNTSETLERAELTALGKALSVVGDQVVTFIEKQTN